MANVATLGFESRYSFEAAGGTFDASSVRFDLVSNTIKKQGEVIDSQGVTGSRTRREDRSRAGLVRVGGTIAMDLSFRMWDFFLPYILGAAEATDTFDVADSLPGFDMLKDSFGSGAQAEKFGELYVNRASLRPNGSLLRLSLDVVGKTYTGGQTFAGAALGAGIEYAPITQYEAAFSVQSTATAVEDWELVIDNQLDVKFRNSQTAQSIRAQDRTVAFNPTAPVSVSTWTTYFGDKTAVNATITLARSSMSSVITLFNLKNPDEGLEQQGKGESLLTLRSMARGDDDDPDISVTNDPVNT
jgi:opacity protein-like surface antigen